MQRALLAMACVFFACSAASAQGSGLSWVATSGGRAVPGQVVGGQEPGRQLVVCRGAHNGGVHPGKVVGQNCNIGWGGREILLPRYEVLVSSAPARLQWRAAGRGGIPGRAVAGGRESGRPLYICRAQHAGGVHPGKVVGQNCNIGYGGREVLVALYEVLTEAPAPRPAPVVTAGLSWVPSAGGRAVPGQVVGGQEPGRQLVVCRGSHNGGVHPGKVVGQNCNIGWGGREILLPRYEVLVSSVPARLQWVAGAGGSIPSRAVAGGQEPGRALYVCRARHAGGVHPGKVVGQNCNIGYGGRELMIGRYEVLTER